MTRTAEGPPINHGLDPYSSFGDEGSQDYGSDVPNLGFHIETLPQFDGSEWRRYEFSNGTFLLTSDGRQLVKDGGLGNLMRAYADAANDGRSVDREARIHLAEGGNAKVFTVGDHELVVKERRPLGDPLEPALERMDMLMHIIQTSCPRWIDIPKHYGIFTDRATGQEFMLMEKIDGGVTAGDILGYGEMPREDHLEEDVVANFGEITPELKEDVRDQFDEMLGILNKVLLDAGLNPEELLPDLEGDKVRKHENLYNVLVVPSKTPLAGKNLKFWVIDQ